MPDFGATRCWCCNSPLKPLTGYCYLCDSEAVKVSPPHVCLRSCRVIDDGTGRPPEFAKLEPDDEVDPNVRKRLAEWRKSDGSEQGGRAKRPPGGR